MTTTALRSITLLGPEGRLTEGSAPAPLWTADWAAPYEARGTPRTQTFPLRSLLLGDTVPLAPREGPLVSGLTHVDRFDAPLLLHARLADREDAASAYRLALGPCEERWDSGHSDARRPFMPQPCEVLLQALPDAGQSWPAPGWEDAAHTRGRIDVPAMRLVAGRIPMWVGGGLAKALQRLLGGLGPQAVVDALWLTPQGMELQARGLALPEAQSSTPLRIGWRGTGAGTELLVEGIGDQALRALLQRYHAQSGPALRVQLSLPGDAPAGVRRTAVWPLQPTAGARGVQVAPAGAAALQQFTLRHCRVRAGLQGGAGDAATAQGGIAWTVDQVAWQGGKAVLGAPAPDAAARLTLQAGSATLNALPQGPLALDYDERRLAERLRGWQSVADEEALQAFVPLQQGWLQLPHANLPGPQALSDRDRIQPPPDDTGHAFDGAMQLRWQGGWALLRGGRGATLELPYEGAADWTLKVDDPDLLLRGLLWLAHEHPDAEDALPTGDSHTLTDLECWLRATPLPPPAEGAETSSAPWRITLPQGLQIDLAHNAAAARFTLDLLPPAVADARPRAWLRHPRLPLLAQMPMLRGAAASARPTGSRQLAPFVQRAPAAAPVRLDVAGGQAAHLLAEGWRRDEGWPWPHANQSLQEGDSHIAFAALGVPGLVVMPPPAAAGFHAWGDVPNALYCALRADLPLLDGALAAAGLPPTEPQAGDDTPDAPTPPSLPPATALDRAAQLRHWRALLRQLSLTRTELAWVVDTFAPGAPVRDVLVSVAPPQQWVTRFGAAFTPDGLGQITFVVGNETRIYSGPAALQGLDGALPAESLKPRPATNLLLVGGAPAARSVQQGLQDARGLTHGPVSQVGADPVLNLLAQHWPLPDGTEQVRRLCTLAEPATLVLPGGQRWRFHATDLPLQPDAAGGGWTLAPATDPAQAWTATAVAGSGHTWRVGAAEEPPRAGERLRLGRFDFTPLRLQALTVGSAAASYPLQNLVLDGLLQPRGLPLRETTAPGVRLVFSADPGGALALQPDAACVLGENGSPAASALRWACTLHVSCLDAPAARNTPTRGAWLQADQDALRRLLALDGSATLQMAMDWLGAPRTWDCTLAADATPGTWPLLLVQPAAAAAPAGSTLALHAEAVQCGAHALELRARLELSLQTRGADGQPIEQLRATSVQHDQLAALHWLGHALTLTDADPPLAALRLNEAARSVVLHGRAGSEPGTAPLQGWPLPAGTVSWGLLARLGQAEATTGSAALALTWMELHYQAASAGAQDSSLSIVHACRQTEDGVLQAELRFQGTMQRDSMVRWPDTGFDAARRWQHRVRIALRGHRLDFAQCVAGPVGQARIALQAPGFEGWSALFEVEHILQREEGQQEENIRRWTCVQPLRWIDGSLWQDELRRRLATAQGVAPARDPSVHRSFLPRYRHGAAEGSAAVPHPGIVDTLQALQGHDGAGWAQHAGAAAAGQLLLASTATLWLPGVGLLHLPFLGRADATATDTRDWEQDDTATLSLFDRPAAGGAAIERGNPLPAALELPEGLDAPALNQALAPTDYDDGAQPPAPRLARAVEQYVQHPPEDGATGFWWKRAAAQWTAVLAAGPLREHPVSLLGHAPADSQAPRRWRVQALRLVPVRQPAPAAAVPHLVSLGLPQGLAGGPVVSGSDQNQVLARHASAWVALRRDPPAAGAPPVFQPVPLPLPAAERLRPARIDALQPPRGDLQPQPQRGWPLAPGDVPSEQRAAVDAVRVTAMQPWRTPGNGLAGWTDALALAGHTAELRPVNEADAPTWLLGRRLPQYLAEPQRDLNGPPVPWQRSALTRARLPAADAVQAALADADADAGAPWQAFLPPALRVRSIGARPGITMAQRWQLLRPAATAALDPNYPRFGRQASPGSSQPYQLRTPRPGPLPAGDCLRPWHASQQGNCRLLAGYACLLQGGETASAWAIWLRVERWLPQANSAVLQLRAEASLLPAPDAMPARMESLRAALSGPGSRVLDGRTTWLVQEAQRVAPPTADGRSCTFTLKLRDSGAPDADATTQAGDRPCFVFDDTLQPGITQSVRLRLPPAGNAAAAAGQPLPPLSPATVLFTDPAYDRTLASAALSGSGGGRSLYLDRRAYHPSDTLFLMADGADGALQMLRYPLGAGTAQSIASPWRVVADRPMGIDLRTLRDGRGQPVALQPGDQLELWVDPGPKVRAPIVARPSVEGPPALYAVLAREPDGHATAVPLSAQAPLPTRLRFVALAQDLRDGLVRRRASFEWTLALQAPATQVFVLKAALDGRMAFADGAGAGGFTETADGLQNAQGVVG